MMTEYPTLNDSGARATVDRMILEVSANANVPDEILLRFKEMGPARRVVRVRAPLRGLGEETVCDLTGWDAGAQAPVPAWARLIEDSGDGIATIVYGGNGGIRLRPVSIVEPWSLESSNQWGEAYLTIKDEKDLVFGDPS